MLIGLTIPRSGHVAGPAVAPPAVVPVMRRLRSDARGMLTMVLGRSHPHSLDRHPVTYFLALLACSSLFGLFVGGYVGFLENATPHADPPYSFAQLAATDAGWATKLRQDWLASHPIESVAAGQRMRETHWQRRTESTATDSEFGGSDGTPSSEIRAGHFVRLDAGVADGMQKTVVTP
jgi:hypothetical protein